MSVTHGQTLIPADETPLPGTAAHWVHFWQKKLGLPEKPPSEMTYGDLRAALSAKADPSAWWGTQEQLPPLALSPIIENKHDLGLLAAVAAQRPDILTHVFDTRNSLPFGFKGTLLHAAFFDKAWEFADWLLSQQDKGVNINDSRGEYQLITRLTPLHLLFNDNPASMPGHFKQFLTAGADPNAADSEGWTPLLLSADRQDNISIVQDMIAHGGDFYATNRRGRSLLQILDENFRDKKQPLLDRKQQVAKVAQPLIKRSEPPLTVAYFKKLDENGHPWLKELLGYGWGEKLIRAHWASDKELHKFYADMLPYYQAKPEIARAFAEVTSPLQGWRGRLERGTDSERRPN